MTSPLKLAKATLCTLFLIHTSLIQAQYVEVDGHQFSLNDKPYYFVGTNLWYGAYLGSQGKAGDRARLIQELNLLQKNGIRNLRVLAGSEASIFEKSVTPSIQTAPGKLNQSLLDGLDFLLSELSKRDMKAVLYLNNFWQWSGGVTEYLAWAEGTVTHDPDVTGNWDDYIDSAASFYRSEKANLLFRDYIRSVVERTNTITGTAYTDDTTIMAWQLANEPRAGINDLPDASKQPFIDWVDETAGFIKSLDKNHLVSSGSEGIAGTSSNVELYLNAHKSKHVDYLTVHLWPKNWGWFDVLKPLETYPLTIEKAEDYVQQHREFATQLNKPIVLEEFGVQRDDGHFAPSSDTTYRDNFFATLFALIEREARQGGPLAGSNFWGWGGIGRTQQKDHTWRTDDDFTGDPPQEPQGLNSVFDIDASTLEVIRTHSLRLDEIITNRNNNAK